MNQNRLYRAMGDIDEDLIEAADRMPLTRQTRVIPARRRLARGTLIAAVLVLLLSLGAGAYYVISHQNTASLMEAGPMSNGGLQPQINEAGMQIIDASAIDLGLRLEDNGTVISVDSAMGFEDPTQSLLYLSFTVTPPAGYEFPEDMKHWCFWDEHFVLEPDDIPISCASSAVRNPDGSAGVLWVLMPQGNTAGHRLHIEIGGFGTADKELAASLYDGSREIELPGHWEFDLELPALPKTREISLDAAALREAGLPVTALRLNEFGGIAETDQQQNPEPWQPRELCLVYPNGSEYKLSFGRYGDNLWLNVDEQGRLFSQILFLNPQPIWEASELILDGVHIPLK